MAAMTMECTLFQNDGATAVPVELTWDTETQTGTVKTSQGVPPSFRHELALQANFEVTLAERRRGRETWRDCRIKWTFA